MLLMGSCRVSPGGVLWKSITLPDLAAISGLAVQCNPSRSGDGKELALELLQLFDDLSERCPVALAPREPPPDNPFLIYEKGRRRSFAAVRRVHYPVGLDHIPGRVIQDWEWYPQSLGYAGGIVKLVFAYRHDLCVQALQRVVPFSQLVQLPSAVCSKKCPVEHHQYVLVPPVRRQRAVRARGRRQLEVRRQITLHGAHCQSRRRRFRGSRSRGISR